LLRYIPASNNKSLFIFNTLTFSNFKEYFLIVFVYNHKHHTLKRKLTGILVLLLLVIQVKGQNIVENLPTFDQDRLHFGFTLGTNFMYFTSVHSGVPDVNGNVWFTDQSTLNPGFHVGIISSLRMNKYLNLRFVPGISFGQRDMHFITETGVLRDSPISVKSTFIETPLLIKYKALRDGNAKPYLVFGPNVRFDLARSRKDDIVLRPIDYYLEMGVGSDFYLPYFRFGLEVRFAIGFNDVLWHDRPPTEGYDPRYTNAISNLYSRLFIIAFNFE
jgi:hypothetical protein